MRINVAAGKRSMRDGYGLPRAPKDAWRRRRRGLPQPSRNVVCVDSPLQRMDQEECRNRGFLDGICLSACAFTCGVPWRDKDRLRQKHPQGPRPDHWQLARRYAYRICFAGKLASRVPISASAKCSWRWQPKRVGPSGKSEKTPFCRRSVDTLRSGSMRARAAAQSTWSWANCPALLGRNGLCCGRRSGSWKSTRTWARRCLRRRSNGCSTPRRERARRFFLRVALLTGMRSGEISTLTWGQVDLAKRCITVGRAKTSSGTGRQIPMNLELFYVLSKHAEWYTDRFGGVNQGFYIFPFGKPVPNDPTRPTTTMKTAWGTLRERAGVNCRLHDLRHTAATKMAEAGVPESTMLLLMGHMSRAMLERYSHIRMAAKRDAVEALSTGQTR